ncbi:hypothetical protein OKJ48_29420, partial [Streptomyces kunmingensis]
LADPVLEYWPFERAQTLLDLAEWLRSLGTAERRPRARPRSGQAERDRARDPEVPSPALAAHGASALPPG